MADDSLSNCGASATEQLSETHATSSRSKLTLARISCAIRELAEKGGSTASSISKLLHKHYGLQVSSGELKKMLIRAVQAGKIKQIPQSNRFILRVPSNFRSRALNRRRRGGSSTNSKKKRGGRRRRSRRRGGKKGKKGKKGRKGKKRGKGKKGKGKRRCGRRGRRGRGRGRGKK